MDAYRDCDLSVFRIGYIGQQETVNGGCLDMFNDLESRSTFLRLPSESVIDARDRIRKGFNK